MPKPQVGVYGVLEKTEEGWEDAQSLISTVEGKLGQAGMNVHLAEDIVCDEETASNVARFFKSEDLDLLVAIIITWSFDNLTVSILREIPLPLAILAVPGIRSGSLVGAQQLGCLLTELGVEHSVFFGSPEDFSTYRPILSYAKAACAKKRLEKGRIGKVGQRTPGMTPIAFDEIEVTGTFGPRVSSFDWEEIEKRKEAIHNATVEKEKNRIQSQISTVEAKEEALDESIRFYLALRGKVQDENFLALSLGCYPQHAGKVCLACSLLGDDGVPCGCEGDLNSSLAMFLLQSFSNQPAHFGEILEVDKKENSIVTSHCGCCPLSLAANNSQIEITPVRLFERGACVRFPAKGGPVTFVNLVGRRGTYRMCAIEGEAVETGMVFEGNPVKVKFDIPINNFLDVIHEKGFGHHWIMGYAHVAGELKHFCRISGIRGVFL